MVSGVTDKPNLCVSATVIIFLLGLTDNTNPPVPGEKYIQGLCGWQRKQHLSSHRQLPAPALPLSPMPGARESERQRRALELLNLPPVLEPGVVLENLLYNNQDGLQEF